MRIGIVNDVPGINELLRRIVDLTPKHQVIWTAESGAEAVELCLKETPDLILMDLVMPRMNGAEATRRIMASTPCAILIVTVSVRDNAGLVLDALTHGAIDAVDIPTVGGDLRSVAGTFLTKIDTMARLIGERPGNGNATARPRRGVPALLRPDRLIAIGASAGGPAVLSTILRGLPKEFPAAIVIVQHVGEQFASGMADWLGQDSALPVRVAEEGDQPTIGSVLLAGTSDHLTMKTADQLGYTADPSDYAYRPSVDVFFKSVGRLWLGEVVGVLLTGMGRDGALGLKALRDRGHYTIAQDEATSPVYGMPKAAAALNAAVDILPAERIAPKLMEVLMCKT
jgi:two-component system, chemotaxis family, response regulator WspF